jgi:hypothetical protein
VRPNLDSLVHKLGAAVVMMVVEDVVDSVADLAAASVLVAAAVVKSTSPTFVTSLLFIHLVESTELTVTSSSLTLWDGRT